MAIQTVTFEINELPSGQYALEVEVPTFDRYKEARKRHPNPERNNRQKQVPYTVDELLFAMCMQKVTLKDGSTVNLDTPQDTIQKLTKIDIRDKQFLLTAFIEMLMLDDELAAEAREFANKELEAEPKIVYTIPKGLLPDSKAAVTINKPTYGTQLECDRRYEGPEVQGTTLEEYMLAVCIGSVDGKPVEIAKDPTLVFNGWSILDVQFLSFIFIRLFTLDTEGRNTAVNLGKSKRPRYGTDKSTPSKSKDTTATRSAATAAP